MSWLFPLAACWLLAQMFVLAAGLWAGDVHWLAWVLVVLPNSVLASGVLVAWYLP